MLKLEILNHWIVPQQGKNHSEIDEEPDFLLSDAELDAINRHFAQKVQEYAQAGEDPASGVKVEFDWVPGLGRFVTANFDSEANGLDISGFTPKRKAST